MSEAKVCKSVYAMGWLEAMERTHPEGVRLTRGYITHLEQRNEQLQHERDEWKAKAEKLEEAFNERGRVLNERDRILAARGDSWERDLSLSERIAKLERKASEQFAYNEGFDDVIEDLRERVARLEKSDDRQLVSNRFVDTALRQVAERLEK